MPRVCVDRRFRGYSPGVTHDQAQAARKELATLDDLVAEVRQRLHAVPSAGRRAQVTAVIAAAAAEETYRSSRQMPEWGNAVSEEWHAHVDGVWRFLAGDVTQHRALSAAVAGFLTGPLNHIEGQDGPDDFDRPQTIAGYAAVLSVVTWGVDFAATAVAQIFELVDLQFDGEHPAERAGVVRREIDRVRSWLAAVPELEQLRAGLPVPPDVLELFRLA